MTTSATGICSRGGGPSTRPALDEIEGTSEWIQRIEALERRVDVAEFMAIANAVNADAVEGRI
jgi:hypothetical protein